MLPGVRSQDRAVDVGSEIPFDIEPAGSVARYESRVGDNPHHAVCRSCDAIADVECAVGHAPCLTASDGHGFVVDEAEVVYWGTCPDCAARRTAQ